MRYVPNSGPLTARIALIGEAPGEQEEKQGAPFVGVSGQFLRDELLKVGIDVASVRIGNVCHYRPPANDINAFIKRSNRKDKQTGKKRKHVIPNELVLNGILELFVELSKMPNLNVIAPLGNTALWALTGNELISRRRGSIYQVTPNLDLLKLYNQQQQLVMVDALTKLNGRKVIPTFHPAFVGRTLEMSPIFRLDLRRIAEESRTRECILPERQVYIDPEEAEARELAAKLLSSPEYSADIETPGGSLFCVGYSCNPSWALVLGADKMWKMELHRALLTSPNPKIFQNGTYDCSFLLKEHAIEVGGFGYDYQADRMLGWDTMLAQHSIYPEWRVGLDFLCSIYTREPYYKDEGKGHDLADFDDVSTYMRYCGKDACTELEVSIHQRRREFKDPAYLETLRYLMHQIPLVIDIQTRGIRIDTKRLEEHKAASVQKVLDLQPQLDAGIIQDCINVANTTKNPKTQAIAIELATKIANGMETINKSGTFVGGFNVGSPIVQKYLYDVRGFKTIYKKRKKKTDFDDDETPTADEEAIKELYGQTGDKRLLDIITIRKERKMQSSYYSMRYDRNGLTYFSINPVGTWSRRWSESQTLTGYGLNFQTLPGKFRDVVIPEFEDMVLVYADLSQAEDRIVAYYANVAKKIWAFENGIDAHVLTASLIFGVDYQALKKEAKAFKERVGKEHPQRFLGKKSNHAFNYGEGPNRFMKSVNKDYDETNVRVDQRQSRQIREGHLRNYPEIRWYWQDVEAQLKNGRCLEGLRVGGSRYAPKWRFAGRLNDETFRKAYSTIPQAIPPEICNRAAVRIHNELLPRTGDRRARVLNQVHDALLVQIPRDGAQQIADEIAAYMRIPVEIHGKEIVIPTDYAIGPNWKEIG